MWDVRWALSSGIVDVIPELLAPGYEKLNILLNNLPAFAYAYRVHLDGHLLRAETTYGWAHAGFQERHAVPRHVELNNLGKYRVASAA